MLVGFLLSSFTASVWLGATGSDELSPGGMAVSQIGLWIGLGGSVVWASRRKGSGRLDDDFGFRFRPVDIAVGVAAGVVAQFGLVRLVAFVLSPLVGHPDVSGPVKDLVNQVHGLGIAALVLFVVVGAPVVEELFFRGLLLRSLQRRIRTGPAVGLSAAVFGAAHLQAMSAAALVVVIVSLVALGVVLGTMAVRTGRLGPGMWTHAAFNACTVVVMLLK